MLWFVSGQWWVDTSSPPALNPPDLTDFPPYFLISCFHLESSRSRHDIYHWQVTLGLHFVHWKKWNISAIHSKYIFTLVQWKIVIFSLYLLFSLCLKVSVTPSRQTLKHYFYLNGSLRLNQSFGVSCDHVTSLRLGTSQSLKISAVRHYLASQAKDHLHVRVCEKTQLNKVRARMCFAWWQHICFWGN